LIDTIAHIFLYSQIGLAAFLILFNLWIMYVTDKQHLSKEK